MKNLKNFLMILAIILIGCSKSEKMASLQSPDYSGAVTSSENYEATEDIKGATEQDTEQKADELGSRGDVIDLQAGIKIPDKIIKTGSISIEAENYKETVKKVKAAVEKFKAYISDENEDNSSYRLGNRMVIRVLSANFDKLIEAISEGEDKVISKTINSQDVTEEYIDIITRLKNKKEVEQRYIDLLKQAKTIGDILEIEDHLRVIREEIESKEGRLKYLNDRVNYSTITVDIFQYVSDWQEPGFFSKVREAFAQGWEGFKIVLIGLLYLWPLWVTALIALVVVLIIVKKRRKK